MRFKCVFTVTAMAMLGMVALLSAQQPGGQRGQGGGREFGGPPPGGGGFVTRMFLLSNPEVRKELELADEQIAEIEKVSAALREKYGGGRGGPGGPGGGQRGNRGKGDNNNQGSLTVPAQWYFVQAQAQNQPGQGQGRGRGGFGQPQTPEERAAQDKARLERAQEERTELAKILLPQQIKRLNEIYIQQAGVSALADEEIAKELGISDAQKAKLAEVRQANQEAMGAQMRELFQGGGGGDREAARAKMDEFRKASDTKMLAVLSADQQKKFEEMKGKPFTMPEGAGRGGAGGPGGNRGRGTRGGTNNN